MAQAISHEEAFQIRQKSAMPMMWIGIVSFIMFWAGITSAYVVRQSQGDWLYFDVPAIFFWSTGVIVFSSVTMALAQWLIRRNKVQASAVLMLVTMVLGLVFMFLQYEGFFDLYEMGVYFTGDGSNASGQYFNIIVWAHAAHVIGGALALIFTSIKAMLKRYSAENHIGIDLCATYWHFLGILWIYLILFLVFIR